MDKITLLTVLAPNGRRMNVKCSPNYTILQILEEVCEKQGLKAEEYDLTHHNHRLDTSSTIRFSGIPNNAFLEMAAAKSTRCESKVTLGLQLENGQRVMGTFDPSDSLYFVLGTLVPDHSLNPVIIYTRREVYGEENLKNTTLRKLGLTSGRAVIRLIHRTPEQLRVQANVSSILPGKPKEDNDTSPPPVKVKKNDFIKPKEGNASDMVLHALKNADVRTSKGTTSKPDKDISSPINTTDEKRIENEVHIIGERNAIVFLHKSNKLPVLEDLPDEFYELTITEAKSLLKDLQMKVKELSDAPFMTPEARQFEKNKKMLNQMNMYKRTIIRVQFPDQIVLQGTFQLLESVKAIIEFVRNYLENPHQEFYLFSAPPKEILDPNKTLLEANCVPSVLLHFGTESQQRSFLKQELGSKFSSFEGARYVATKLR